MCVRIHNIYSAVGAAKAATATGAGAAPAKDHHHHLLLPLHPNLDLRAALVAYPRVRCSSSEAA